jgi:hypothetical protein
MITAALYDFSVGASPEFDGLTYPNVGLKTREHLTSPFSGWFFRDFEWGFSCFGCSRLPLKPLVHFDGDAGWQRGLYKKSTYVRFQNFVY